MELKRFRTLLRKNGNFITMPRLRLFTLLQKQSALTIQQLVSLLPSQDQATIYRNVDLFERLGIINRLRLGWDTKIELSDIFKHHHHHFTCVKCGKIIVLQENNLIEREIRKLGDSRRFKAMDHQLEIRGLCRNCFEK